MKTATAAWDLNRLTTTLNAVGWGATLAERHDAGTRKVLQALTATLPWGAAAGRVTLAQLADVVRMTPGWISRCLRRLEDLGLVAWRRGGILNGNSRPGYVRVNKKRIAELINEARGWLEPKRAARKAATAERANTLRNRTTPPQKRHNPLSFHTTLSHYPTYIGSTRESGGTAKTIPPTPDGIPAHLWKRYNRCPLCSRSWDAHDYYNRTGEDTYCEGVPA